MKVDGMLTTARETLTARRVFADPYERDGVTVIPGAIVAGGGGGGGGQDREGQQGEGGGFGVNARPAGAFVIRNGKVRWQPAVDVNRLVAVIGAVGIALLMIRARGRSARRRRGRRGVNR